MRGTEWSEEDWVERGGLSGARGIEWMRVTIGWRYIQLY